MIWPTISGKSYVGDTVKSMTLDDMDDMTLDDWRVGRVEES
jgi:hypothetical protein